MVPDSTRTVLVLYEHTGYTCGGGGSARTGRLVTGLGCAGIYLSCFRAVQVVFFPGLYYDINMMVD